MDFALAAVGVFSLLVGASVRLRRPDHQATLHFFWLTVAFFGASIASFSARSSASLPHAKLMRAIEAIGTRVAPALKGDLAAAS